MTFTRKIYCNDKPLLLTTDTATCLATMPQAAAFRAFPTLTDKVLKEALGVLDMADSHGVVIEVASEAAADAVLTSMFQPIDAGGGIVYSETGDILMIFRRGKWDLPKGKLDKGETLAECAVREVCEETGLQTVALGEKICDSYHIYTQHKTPMIKRTAWYKMHADSHQRLQPQQEENIMEARWIPATDLAPYAAKTYEAVREVMHLAGLEWH